MFRSSTLHSNDVEFPAGLHRCHPVCDYNKWSWSKISCLACPHQKSGGKHSSVQVSAKDTNTQRQDEEHISSAHKGKIRGLFPNPGNAGHSASCRAEVSPGRSPAASCLLRDVHLPTLSVEVHWQSLSHREARSIQGYHYRKEEMTATLQLLMTIKTF